MAKAKSKRGARAPARSTIRPERDAALARVADLEAASRLREEMMRLSKEMIAAYERTGVSVASALRMLAEQVHVQGATDTAAHLRREATRLDPPPVCVSTECDAHAGRRWDMEERPRG